MALAYRLVVAEKVVGTSSPSLRHCAPPAWTMSLPDLHRFASGVGPHSVLAIDLPEARSVRLPLPLPSAAAFRMAGRWWRGESGHLPLICTHKVRQTHPEVNLAFIRHCFYCARLCVPGRWRWSAQQAEPCRVGAPTSAAPQLSSGRASAADHRGTRPGMRNNECWAVSTAGADRRPDPMILAM